MPCVGIHRVVGGVGERLFDDLSMWPENVRMEHDLCSISFGGGQGRHQGSINPNMPSHRGHIEDLLASNMITIISPVQQKLGTEKLYGGWRN